MTQMSFGKLEFMIESLIVETVNSGVDTSDYVLLVSPQIYQYLDFEAYLKQKVHYDFHSSTKLYFQLDRQYEIISMPEISNENIYFVKGFNRGINYKSF